MILLILACYFLCQKKQIKAMRKMIRFSYEAKTAYLAVWLQPWGPRVSQQPRPRESFSQLRKPGIRNHPTSRDSQPAASPILRGREDTEERTPRGTQPRLLGADSSHRARSGQLLCSHCPAEWDPLGPGPRPRMGLAGGRMGGYLETDLPPAPEFLGMDWGQD